MPIMAILSVLVFPLQFVTTQTTKLTLSVGLIMFLYLGPLYKLLKNYLNRKNKKKKEKRWTVYLHILLYVCLGGYVSKLSCKAKYRKGTLMSQRINEMDECRCHVGCKTYALRYYSQQI